MPWTDLFGAGNKGQQAERLACRYLQQQGLILVSQNYRCRTGEIDLIMRDNDQLVFVEVKYRQRADFGHASEYFHSHKRRKFMSAIRHYLVEKQLNPAFTPQRIDVIAIEGTDIQWHKAV